MSETLLESLMRLFAVFTDIGKESKTGRARAMVEDFLSKNFNREYTRQYLNRFEVYMNRYHSKDYSKNATEKNKQLDENKSRLIDISTKINSELEQEPKLILFTQLLGFLGNENEISSDVDNFINLLAGYFRIEMSDYDNLKNFILKSAIDVPDKKQILLICGRKESPHPDMKTIYNPKQQVSVWMLHIKSTNTFIFKYSGERNLYLNGHKVEPNKPYPFAVGSVMRTSLMPPLYYGRVAEKFIQRIDKARIIYRAIDVVYKFGNNQYGVRPFSFTGRSGQLVGIMGGSGTGKSTLLNVLNGNYKINQGKITINGFDIQNEKDALRGVIGYVPQEDLLKEELTVFENLWFNAKFCFSKMNNAEIKDVVERALQDFDLVEARNLVVGTPLNKILSGGQRKRLNIALELIREPSVLFVDEPTSGLSSMDSEKVMLLLKRQVLKGKLVIINIHQPSSDLYKLLDKLLMIDKGGRIIYSGNPIDAIAYFKKVANYVNPEERECYVCGNVKTEQPLRIVEARMVNPYGKLIRQRKVSPEEWYQLYTENFEKKYDWKSKRLFTKKEPFPQSRYSVPGRWKQFRIYALRDALSKLKDKQSLIITFLEAPLLALILGFFTKYLIGSGVESPTYIFSENVNIPAYLFMSAVVMIFLGLNVSAEEIIKERRLLKREGFLNLSRFSFLNSKVCILFIISAIQSLSFVLVGNVILEIKGMMFEYWLILFTSSCFANMLGLNISSGLNSVVAIYILIPLILIPHLLFSGVIVNYDKLHKSIASHEFVPRIGDVMVSRWAYEALAVTQFKDNKYEKFFFDDEMNMSQNSYYGSFLIPELTKQNDACLWNLEQDDTQKLSEHWNLLRAMIGRFHNYFPDVFSSEISAYGENEFSSSVHAKIKAELEKGKDYFNQQYRHYSLMKDKKMNELILEMRGVDNVVAFKQKYYNEALADWLLNRKNTRQFEYDGNNIIQKKDPIFEQSKGKWGRSHFYASYKNLGQLTLSTPVFNIIVMWLGCLLFYVMLYFDLLRKIIHYFESLKLGRLNKRLQKLGT